MLGVLARNWWTLLIRGIAAVVFGVLAFAWPGATIVAIVILFGAYAFVDGVFAIVAAIRAAQSHERWWPFLLEGIVGIAIAAIMFFEPRAAAFGLYFTIAVWAFLTGILEIAAAIQLRKQIANELWLILAGVLSLLFGVLDALAAAGRCHRDRLGDRRVRHRVRHHDDRPELCACGRPQRPKRCTATTPP